jgi:hypothetical protein
MNVTKFTLSTGKAVYFREPKIGDTEHATKLAGMQAGSENQALLMVLFQKEMIKLLLVQVDEHKPTMLEKAQMDSLFTFQEYNQLSKALKLLVGDEGNSELIPELVSL